MGYDWRHSGVVRLKGGSTLQDVLNLYPCSELEPHLPLHSSGSAEFEDGHVKIDVREGLLEYQADGQSGALDDIFTDFLSAVAEELAAAGWIDYELDDFEAPYGPTELARAEARLESARVALQSAQHELTLAEGELRRLKSAHA